MMKMLALDIETSPASFWGYGMFNQNFSISQIRSHPYILGWATRWVGKPKNTCTWRWADEKGAFEELWDQLDEATHVLHYNGTRFDMPWINAEFRRLNVNGGAKPFSYKQIDLLKQVRRNFRLLSNKLDYSSRALTHLEGKVQASALDLFLRMQSEDPKVVERARRDMVRYGKQDVNLLPDMYHDLLPWLRGIDAGLYTFDPTEPVCPNCKSGKIIRKGFEYTSAGRYQRYRCTNCGTPLRANRAVDIAPMRNTP